MIKSFVQKTLRRAGLYHRLKRSALYDLYWSMANRRLIDDRKTEVEFFRSLVGASSPELLIFDIGANQGQKVDIFLRLGARVIAVEPDSTNQAILRDSFLRRRLKPLPVTIVGKAVGSSVGQVEMWVDEPGSAKNTLSAKWVDTLRTDSTRFGKNLAFQNKTIVETTTVDELIKQYGSPQFIKIDVEGYEPEVLSGLHQKVPAISFEVNLPEFVAEGRKCIELLHQLNPTGAFNYATDFGAGFVLPQWLERGAFLPHFDGCKETSIEIFWRSR
ncbi:MAG TPA: FkbM family methyltransferase [Candidatus Didemnitutus sp.]|jgi:FkbM family methyltransferase